jgi:broad specificity phosphatase PhoE
MPSITVIRHSVAVANEQKILMGAKFESPLSDKGREIARQKGAALKAAGFIPDRVYTSELTRARQTAEIILAELKAAPIITELLQLNERDFGEHDGKPYDSVLQAFATYGENPPTIETVEDFVARVSEAWEMIKADAGQCTLVVTHSNPEMVLQTLAFNPQNVNRFWELGDPTYCEGFEVTLD